MPHAIRLTETKLTDAEGAARGTAPGGTAPRSGSCPRRDHNVSGMADLAVGYALGLMMTVAACMGTTGQVLAVAAGALLALGLMVCAVGLALLMRNILPPEDDA